MKKNTITLAIKYLRSAGFPGERVFNKETTAAWIELFADIPDDKFITAIKNIVKTSKYFPTIAEIREEVFKSTTLLPDDAWAEVLDQINKVCGTGKTALFSSPLIKSVVRSLGGLDTIWQAGIEKEGIYRAHFIKYYTARSEREKENLMIGEPTEEEAAEILNQFGLEPKGIE